MFAYYRYKKLMIGFGSLLIIGIFLAFIIISQLKDKPSDEVKKIVEDFYTSEQEGKFASSWELFHPIMKEKFNKSHYIQDRAHVFINHFGVETFSFHVGKPEKLKSWRITKGSPDYENVFKVNVTQTYESKYGNLQLQQDVIVIQEDDEWTIAWDYHFHGDDL